MLTTEQQRVFDWLNDKLGLPVFAEAYKGALHLLDERSPGLYHICSTHRQGL